MPLFPLAVENTADRGQSGQKGTAAIYARSGDRNRSVAARTASPNRILFTSGIRFASRSTRTNEIRKARMHRSFSPAFSPLARFCFRGADVYLVSRFIKIRQSAIFQPGKARSNRQQATLKAPPSNILGFLFKKDANGPVFRGSELPSRDYQLPRGMNGRATPEAFQTQPGTNFSSLFTDFSGILEALRD